MCTEELMEFPILYYVTAVIEIFLTFNPIGLTYLMNLLFWYVYLLYIFYNIYICIHIHVYIHFINSISQEDTDEV